MDATNFTYGDIVEEQIIQLTDDLEIKEDPCYMNAKVTKDIGVQFLYDSVMNEFLFTISKQNKQSDEIKSVSLNEIEMMGLLKKFPIARGLIRKYTYMKSSKPIDIPFELEKFNDVNDLKAVLSVKENLYRKGDLQLDIRKCIKRDGKFIHTRDGVRVKSEEAELLLPKLHEALDTIQRQTGITRDIILHADVCLIVECIRDLHSQQGCYGCKTEHGSQKQHMEVGGCARSWEDQVNDYWESSTVLIESAHVRDLAQKLANHYPNTALVISRVDEMKTPSSDEKRAKVTAIETLNENEFFQTCQQLKQQ